MSQLDCALHMIHILVFKDRHHAFSLSCMSFNFQYDALPFEPYQKVQLKPAVLMEIVQLLSGFTQEILLIFSQQVALHLIYKLNILCLEETIHHIRQTTDNDITIQQIHHRLVNPIRDYSTTATFFPPNNPHALHFFKGINNKQQHYFQQHNDTFNRITTYTIQWFIFLQFNHNPLG